ncbi:MULTISPECIES: SRPBCC family protein [unclassified Caulobacter]|uniref:SRPBCC family protein n=1 Tax=unclassified Caulobacter TaxID=2648921 RepID=UPI000D38B219|nr:polyketide cyclase [Caulobacter sp. HMWF009]PTT05057.1 polyketide cyclase [Caulobacter sp. HMWF025]
MAVNWTGAAIALALAVGLGPAAAAFDLTPRAQAALARGEAYADVSPDPDGISGHVRGVIDIDAPPEQVWKVMTDCATAGKLITNLASCRVTSGDQKRGWDVREHVTRRNLVFPGLRIVFRSDYEPVSRIRFKLVEGDLKAQQGEWRLQALNGGRGTRVFYDNRLAVDWPVPRSLIREALRKDVPKVLVNLRRACEGA